MKKEVENNPIVSVARAEEKVKHEWMDEYLHDPILRGEIISTLPVKVKSTLNQHKAKIIGHLPGRDL